MPPNLIGTSLEPHWNLIGTSPSDHRETTERTPKEDNDYEKTILDAASPKCKKNRASTDDISVTT